MCSSAGDTPSISRIGGALLDPSSPLKQRFRALFTLKNLGGAEAVDAIGRCLMTDSSDLLKHECAYCLGQMQDKRALPVLERILQDEGQAVIVRHEAGEALGAIGDPSSAALLQRFADHPEKPLAETSELAVERIDWLLNSEPQTAHSPYNSVDPSPPLTNHSLSQLESLLADDGASLFARYRALFGLRDMGGADAVRALGAVGLTAKPAARSSALLRHEVAFALGQMRDPAAVPFLVDRLADRREHPMVRHECAEALGAIGTAECRRTLTGYLTDPERVVRESCEVALDISDYNASSEQFQYADGLVEVK